MNNLFSEYELVVFMAESSIHDLFSRYEPILVIINKPKIISGPFRCVELFAIRTAHSQIRLITSQPHKNTNVTWAFRSMSVINKW